MKIKPIISLLRFTVIYFTELDSFRANHYDGLESDYTYHANSKSLDNVTMSFVRERLYFSK